MAYERIYFDGENRVKLFSDLDKIIDPYDGQKVTVEDAIGDITTLGGEVEYQYNKGLAKWTKTWTSTKDTLNFTIDKKIISGGKVTASFVPQNQFITDITVRDTRNFVVKMYDPNGVIVDNAVIDIQTTDFDGYTLQFSYAYGEAQARLDNFSKSAEQITVDVIPNAKNVKQALIEIMNAITGITPEFLASKLGFTPADVANLSKVATTNQYADLTGLPDLSLKSDKSETYTKAESDSKLEAEILKLVGLAPAELDTIFELVARLKLDEDGLNALIQTVAMKADKTALSATSDVVFNSVTDSLGGLRSIPVTAITAAKTLAATDNGVAINTTAAVTIPTGLAVGFNTMIFNDSATAITITANTGITARISGATATKASFSLPAYESVTVWSNKTNNFILAGNVS